MKAYELGGMGDALAAAFALADNQRERVSMKRSEMQEFLLKTGGPAYPGQIVNDDKSHYAFPGMTVRDYFAGQVIAIMAQDGLKDGDFTHYCRQAFQIADAMVEARGEIWKSALRPVNVAAG